MAPKLVIYSMLKIYLDNKKEIKFTIELKSNDIIIHYNILKEFKKVLRINLNRFCLEYNKHNIDVFTQIIIMCYVLNEICMCINHPEDLKRKTDFLKIVENKFIFNTDYFLLKIYNSLLSKIKDFDDTNVSFLLSPIIDYYSTIKKNEYHFTEKVCVNCGIIILHNSKKNNITHCEQCLINTNTNYIYHKIEYNSDTIRYDYIMDNSKILSNNYIFDNYIQKIKKLNKSFVKKDKKQRELLKTYYRYSKPFVELYKRDKIDSLFKNLISKIKENN